jgi:hypothetical protein
MLHSILSKLPRPLHLEPLITRTRALFAAHPPTHLATWRHISPASVLRTTRDPRVLARQTLADGETLFRTHAAEIERRDARRRAWVRARSLAVRYRRPVCWTGGALVVALLAMYWRPVRASALLGLAAELWGL